MKLFLRKADKSDYEELCRIIKQVDFLHHRNLPNIFENNPGPARTPEYLFSIIDGEKKEIIVAETDEKILGLVIIGIETSPDYSVLIPRKYVLIDNIAVDDNYRNKGVGTALMKKVHKWAKSRNINEIVLNVYEFNDEAIEFYKKLGYRTRSRRMAVKLNKIN
ncbi:MAG: GNAT family N-acetyltransferase [Candidatus Mcinerneyibacterium aminivorans]|uniref:GNAT family N-acetyltransferase n=1 Tax=Candidatus Mcinerneyibacterium aminivorans TaxID=2703815 RepID=A0A5D0MCW2_9BACT|nr:MAG: GNAT family N-acetyltransferase [Candidatus Mcinerneyibacterium aminivorans]